MKRLHLNRRVLMVGLCVALLTLLVGRHVAAQGPTIIIHEPQDGTIAQSQTIPLRALVTAPEATSLERIEVWVNGVPVLYQDKGVDPVLPGEVSHDIPLTQGENLIVVLAVNDTGQSAEQAVTVVYTPSRIQKPNLYILAIGVRDYADDKFDLSYADADARAVVDAFAGQKGRLFGEIETHLLLNQDASRSNILKGLDWIWRAVSERDLAIVFVSGHGVLHELGASYHFLPHDGDPSSLSDTAIPWFRFENVLQNLPGKTVFFVDTCHAGGVTGTGTKSVALDLMAVEDFSTAGRGLMVMASSTGNEFSREDPAWEHGAYTRAILDGLTGKGDYDGNGVIDTGELGSYVSTRVKELTGGLQHPTSETTTGYSAFPLFVLAQGRGPMPTQEPVEGTPKDVPTATFTPIPTDAPLPDLPATATAVAATLAAQLPPTDTPISGPVMGDTWTRPADGMEMVYVPGGEFQMGSTAEEVEQAFQICKKYEPDCKREGFEREKPLHSVTVSDFWLDRTEVTNAQFARFVEDTGHQTDAEKAPEGDSEFIDPYWAYSRDATWQNPRAAPGGDDKIVGLENHPVVQVSWNDAQAYCKWGGARLPTEAEWEYAARGPESRTYPWGNTFDASRGNFGGTGDGYEYTAPVGGFPEGASWVGALDQAGNAWEWVADWYGDYPAGRQVNPTGPTSGDDRVLRGGSWYQSSTEVRSALRHSNVPVGSFVDDGFRCARNS